MMRIICYCPTCEAYHYFRFLEQFGINLIVCEECKTILGASFIVPDEIEDKICTNDFCAIMESQVKGIDAKKLRKIGFVMSSDHKASPECLPQEIINARDELKKIKALLQEEPYFVELSHFIAYVFIGKKGAIPVILPKKGFEGFKLDLPDLGELKERIRDLPKILLFTENGKPIEHCGECPYYDWGPDTYGEVIGGILQMLNRVATGFKSITFEQNEKGRFFVKSEIPL